MVEIPKIIHYCWFGNNPKPKLFYRCLESWKKYCPEYEIIEWNEHNFDVTISSFSKSAYENKKWAFVSDIARLVVLYNYGGIYVDTDVEFIKPIDELLTHKVVTGYEQEAYGKHYIATGLFTASEKGHPWIKCLLDDYSARKFELNSKEPISCTYLNTQVSINKFGLVPNGENVLLRDDVHVCQADFFCPINYSTGKKNISPNSYTIHHYAGSWLSPREKIDMKLRRFLGHKIYFVLKTIFHRG